MTRFTKLFRLAAALTLLLAFAAVSLLPPTPAQAATCAATYTVVAGDSLSAIALKYETTVLDIANANGLKEPYTLQIGQKLCIPGTPSSTPTSGTTTSGKKLTFLATFSGNWVTIELKNFPAKSNYYMVANTYGKSARYHLGVLNTQKLATVKKMFQIPKALRSSKKLTLCLKNVRTDAALCYTYTVTTKR